MCDKILPIKRSPIITYLHYAYDLEILLSYEPFIPSFHMNFIQINFLKEYFYKINIHYMDFYYTQLAIPYWLTNEIIPTDEWNGQNQSISELVVQYIDQGYYIRKMVDEYYLPVREAFGKYHFNHTLQIFGYNLKDKIFHVSGFDESHLYGFQTITFDDFEKSIQNSNAPFSKIKIDKRAHYAFDIQLFKNILNQYLLSQGTSQVLQKVNSFENERYTKQKLYWGAEVHVALQTYLSHLIRDEVYYDIAPFHLLYEHKLCMLLKIDYLRKTGYISCENNIYARYNTIVDLSLTVRNMIMKYKMSNNSKILLKARDMLEEINTKEQKLLTELLYYI